MGLLLCLTAIVALICGDGCSRSWPWSFPRGLVVSPRSDVAAFLWMDELWGVNDRGEERLVRGALDARWFPLGSPLSTNSIRLSSYTEHPEWHQDPPDPAPIKFSGDGLHLVALDAGALYCVDTRTKSARRLTHEDEVVTTFAWLSTDEIGYASSFKRRVLYRQGIGAPAAERLAVYDDGFVSTIKCDTQREWWSPDGRFVVLRKLEGGYELVSTAPNYFARRLGGTSLKYDLVVWKPDSSCVIILARDRDMIVRHVILAQAPSGDFSDLSGPFVETFPDPMFDSSWTADGQYLIVNSSRFGGCLVRLDTWDVIRVGERLPSIKFLWIRVGDKSRTPFVWGVPIQGWVKATLGIDEFSPEVAVNYERWSVVTLMNYLVASSPPGAVLAPDGKHAVAVNRLGGIQVRRIDLVKDAVHHLD